MPTKWPTEDQPALAKIAPTEYGTFGIQWADFEAMERRGGYSGPYQTREEAEQGARDWADYFDSPLRIIHVDETPNEWKLC